MTLFRNVSSTAIREYKSLYKGCNSWPCRYKCRGKGDGNRLIGACIAASRGGFEEEATGKGLYKIECHMA